MSIKIEGTTITMTRGDTLKVYTIPQYEDGSEYEPEANDTIRFAMKRRFEDTKTLLTKNISTDLYGTAATNNSDVNAYVFKIEGYYD